MLEARQAEEERDAVDIEGGGYEGVALAIMAAISRGEPATLILNVRNDGTVWCVPDDAVVEVPCLVDRAGPRPLAVRPPAGHMGGLIQQVKEVERLTIAAARERAPAMALKAFALHPLVDSVTTARSLLHGYREADPMIASLFEGR